MTINVYVQPVISIIAGILILMRPAMLPVIVGVYLLVVGILGLVR